MQDERSMILNMLKEGKISVEEADALLDVLDEKPEDEPVGFAAAESGTATKSGTEMGSETETESEPAEASGGGDRGRAGSGHQRTHRHGFNVDFDLGNLKESLRETMKGVSETVKDVMAELSELDIGSEVFKAMGKIRAEVTREFTEPAGDARQLKLTNRWGDINVTGAEVEELSVTANAAAWGRSQEDAAAIIAALDINLVREGETLVVKSGLEEKPAGRVRLDYEITVPRRMGAILSSESGDIRVEALEGQQEIKTLSGDLNVADLGGPGVIQSFATRSGGFVGGALTGDITVKGLSGDMDINGFDGTLVATAQSGDIVVQDGSGPVELKTMSGDITVDLTSAGPGPLNLSSVSGDVELRLPTGVGTKLVARSTSGDVDADLELSVERQTEHELCGTAGDGGIELCVTTVSGDISISQE